MNKRFYIENATWDGVLSYIKHTFKVRSTGSMILICPFHLERTPSFFIRADRIKATCFGCGWTGTLRDFAARLFPNRSPDETLWITYGGNTYVPEEQLNLPFS